MKRIPFIVVPLVLMFVVAAVWMSPAAGTKAPTPSLGVSAPAPADLSPEPVPRVVEDSDCFWDCGVAGIYSAGGGACWVYFSVFHSNTTGGCCAHQPPDQVEFGYNLHGTQFWSVGSAYKGGASVYEDPPGCYGYFYATNWYQLGDGSYYDYYFRCPNGCYCEYYNQLIEC